jgi:hypothetical protein
VGGVDFREKYERIIAQGGGGYAPNQFCISVVLWLYD